MPREQPNQQPVANPLGQQQNSNSRARQQRQIDDSDDMGGRVKNQQQPEARNNNNNNNNRNGKNNNNNNADANKDPRANLHGKDLEFTTLAGAVYRGDFDNGLMHGKGRYDFTNGDSYEGD